MANSAIAETLIDEGLEGQVLGHGIDRPSCPTCRWTTTATLAAKKS